MVDDWEAAQPGYSRTLDVMRRVRTALDDLFAEAGPAGDSAAPGGIAAHAVPLSEGELP